MRAAAGFLLRFGGLATFGVATVFAADDSSSSAPTVSLSSAKHDYEMVKALEVPPEQSQLLLPLDQIPVLQSKSAAPPTLSLLERQRLDEAKLLTKAPAKNWLIDAMEPKSATRAVALRTSEFGITEKSTARTNETNFAASALPRRHTTAEKSSLKSAVKLDAAASPNPLAAYLSGWLTPGDFALLKPAADTSLESSRDAGIGTKDAPGRLEMPTGPFETRVTLDGSSRASTSPNPYLSDLVGPTASSSSPVSIATAGLKPVEVKTAEAPARLNEVPAQYSPANPPSHDFLQTDDDAKYFKQLKRF